MNVVRRIRFYPNPLTPRANERFAMHHWRSGEGRFGSRAALGGHRWERRLLPSKRPSGPAAGAADSGQQPTPAVHTGSERLGNQPGDLSGGFEKCRSIEDYAVLLTPQKNGSGPDTIPLTFLRET